jgi:small subunit ribosomal protein S20
MANIKSSIKRIDITKRNSLRNRQTLSKLRTLTKKYYSALNKYESMPSDITLKFVNIVFQTLTSIIDKSTKRKVIHKNTAARKKSSLHLSLNNSLKKNA